MNPNIIPLWVIEQTSKPLPEVYRYFAKSEYIQLAHHYGGQLFGKNVSYRTRKAEREECELSKSYDAPVLE